MAESFVQVAPDSTGKLLRTQTSTQGGNTVHAEVLTLADSAGNLIGSNSTAAAGLQVVSLTTGQFANSILTSIIPSTAALVNASAAVAVNTANNQTLAGASAKTTYILGFSVTTQGGSAAAAGVVTVTGLATTLNYEVGAAANNAVNFTVVFPYPLPASATNTAIVVTVPGLGANTGAAASTAYGFQL